MNVIQRFFTKGGRMQATAEHTGIELELRLSEIEEQLQRGDGDVSALLQEKEVIKHKQKAARIAKERRQTEEYQARMKDRGDRWRRERDEVFARLREHLPAAQYYLAALAVLNDRMDEEGSGKSAAEILGLPHAAARRLSEAIGQAIRGTQLEHESYEPPEMQRLLVPNAPPAPRPKPRKRTAAEWRELGFTPGPPIILPYPWNLPPLPPEQEPPIDGEGTSGMFLP